MTDKSLYIGGYPIVTEYGIVNHYRVKDFIGDKRQEISLLKLAWFEVKSEIIAEIKNNKERYEKYFNDVDKTINELRKKSLVSLIHTNFMGLKVRYDEVLSNIITDYNEKQFLYQFITDEDFEKFRKTILDINSIDYVDWYQDPRLRHHQRLDIYFKSQTGKTIDFNTMYTTFISKGFTEEQVNEMTLCTFFRTFERIQLEWSNLITVILKTVDSKNKIEVIDWYQSTLEKKNTEKTIEQVRKEYSPFSK